MLWPWRTSGSQLIWLAVGLIAAVPTTRADDAYYEIPLDELKITAGELPRQWRDVDWRERQRVQALVPYAVLDGEGEVYLGQSVARPAALDVPGGTRNLEPAPEVNELQPENGEAVAQPQTANPQALAIRAPRDQKITGSLFVPKEDFSGLERLRFEVTPSQAGRNERARRNFLLTKRDHYQRLLQRNLPGAAWFRHQARAAQEELAGKPVGPPATNQNQPQRNFQRDSELERTFAVFSGGRAVSENLQLDRLLPTTKPEEPTIPLADIPGITVEEMDWKELTKDADPRLDALASILPQDQHALLFPSFGAMVSLMDEAARQGTPLLFLVQGRAESVGARQWYERQLCLSIDAVSRLLGDQLVQEVAFTGSDPYLRTGTDVAVIFQSDSPGPLKAALAARHRAAAAAHGDCESVSDQLQGVDYEGVRTPDRRICSYLAVLDGAVVVTNSPAQLERLIEVSHSPAQSLAMLPEYKFFRQRYRKGDSAETGLLIVTDATIRRWCSPKWRIATSRRSRAAGVLAELQARHLEELARGDVRPRELDAGLHVADLGTLRLTSSGVISSTYGSLSFQTPISELDFEKVTPEEQRLYERWRQGYQRNWSQFFDPIAVRFSVSPEQLSADLTVMPLIAGTEYEQWIDLAGDARIRPDAADRHAGALAHWSMALDADSRLVQMAGNFAQQAIGRQANPLSWLGESIAVYADEDPYWRELATAEDHERFLEQNFHRLPVAVRFEVSNGLKLAVFLTGLRGFVQQTAPNLTVWESLEHNDQAYVKITPAPGSNTGVPEELAIFYATTPQALVVTLNESLLKRALDRELRRAGQRKASPRANAEDGKGDEGAQKELPPWLGESMNLHLTGAGVKLLARAVGEEYQQAMQRRAWANLPILNEWRRRYTQRDPVEFHDTYWQTQLVCPGGGKYVWNEEFQTLESTVYGHAGAPQSGPEAPPPLEPVEFVNFGVTFEHKGLRARTVIDRK